MGPWLLHDSMVWFIRHGVIMGALRCASPAAQMLGRFLNGVHRATFGGQPARLKLRPLFHPAVAAPLPPPLLSRAMCHHWTATATCCCGHLFGCLYSGARTRLCHTVLTLYIWPLSDVFAAALELNVSVLATWFEMNAVASELCSATPSHHHYIPCTHPIGIVMLVALCNEWCNISWAHLHYIESSTPNVQRTTAS